jgi:hypothetical protein
LNHGGFEFESSDYSIPVILIESFLDLGKLSQAWHFIGLAELDFIQDQFPRFLQRCLDRILTGFDVAGIDRQAFAILIKFAS